MTNSLSLGCDCKGSIHYLDAHLPTRAGSVKTVKNAVCIHEEDDGILFKHSDFRDDSTVVTRARKLVVQQVFTAANYEYAVQWAFHQDGTIQPDIRLTGILQTYGMRADEDTHGWGTEVYLGVNAHNHQHLFCLRIDANVDGPKNTVFMVDAVPSDAPVGSAENYYGNAFYAKRTKLATTGQAKTDYNGATSRTWDICNTSKLNPYSKKPVSYKLVSREVPGLLPKENSLVWKRAGFARHAVHVTKCTFLCSFTFPARESLDTNSAPHARLGRPDLPGRPTRAPDLGRALGRTARVGGRRQRERRQRGHRAVAHFRGDAHPCARGLPRDACRADHAAAAAEELLHLQPGHGRAAVVRQHAEPGACRREGRARRGGQA